MTETQNQSINPRRIALIGFGEVGQRVGKEGARIFERTIIASLEETSPRWIGKSSSAISSAALCSRAAAAPPRCGEVAETALGLTPSMAAATAERQDWLAEAVARCSRCIESCGSRQRPSHKDAAIIPLRNRSTIGTKAWLPH
jgi:hypothetical protein